MNVNNWDTGEYFGPVNISFSADISSCSLQRLAKCKSELLIADPSKGNPDIEYVHWDIYFYIRHLITLIKKYHPLCQFSLTPGRRKYLALPHQRFFRETVNSTLVEAECSAREAQWMDTWKKYREEPRSKRFWNHSWYYPVDKCRVTYNSAPGLKQGRELGILLLECLHSDEDLWTRIDGRYFVSCEFFCKLDNYHCLCFCIDTKLCSVKTLYKNRKGHYFSAPQLFSPAIQTCLPSCLKHLPFPSLTDICLVSLLKSKNPETLFKFPLPCFLRARAVQLHTYMLRFNKWKVASL